MQTPITITDEAAEKILQKTQQKEEAIGLRLTIQSTGCSGHSYAMDYVLNEDLQADDKFEHENAILYVPKIHSWMLFGIQIGYEETAMHSGFTFDNPNEAGRCGCGESFTVERSENG